MWFYFTTQGKSNRQFLLIALFMGTWLLAFVLPFKGLFELNILLLFVSLFTLPGLQLKLLSGPVTVLKLWQLLSLPWQYEILLLSLLLFLAFGLIALLRGSVSKHPRETFLICAISILVMSEYF
jgi:hypothetical protein